MRLLGGILRPSRNQVTCGRGKLEMRGARMTAASPWDTLWCFSPSSKLPMSVGKRGAEVRGQSSLRVCSAEEERCQEEDHEEKVISLGAPHIPPGMSNLDPRLAARIPGQL